MMLCTFLVMLQMFTCREAASKQDTLININRILVRQPVPVYNYAYSR